MTCNVLSSDLLCHNISVKGTNERCDFNQIELMYAVDHICYCLSDTHDAVMEPSPWSKYVLKSLFIYLLLKHLVILKNLFNYFAMKIFFQNENDWLIDIWCLMPLSAISCRPVLVVEEAGVPGENHRPSTSNW